MIIKSLELKNFRNIEDLCIYLEKGINVLYGDNAQGKTNILEALYMSGTTRSHRGSSDRDMIRFGYEEAHIRTVFEKNEVGRRIDIHLKKNDAKGIALSGVPVKKAGDIFGLLNMVIFSPEDLNIIKQGPSYRRHFIDMELSQLDKIYMHNLSSYNRALKQRNKLLKDIYFRPELDSTLPVWDEQLIIYGEKIIEKRKKFIEELSELVYSIHKELSGSSEDIEVRYEADTDEELLEDVIVQNKERDIKTGTTNNGPHRDDMVFIINGNDIRRYGSQGQQRTAALSLKMAEIKMVKRKTGDTPILLLDDVLSELDSGRQEYLLENIGDTQTVITCTGLDEFVKNAVNIDRVFSVKCGMVTAR